MIHLCTFSDKNYLVLGLTLYESLVRYCDEFVLHYLALDDYTYNKLKEYECKTLKVYSSKDLESDEYKQLTERNISRPTRTSPYHYSHTAFFCHYLLDKNLPHILYIDADICFYANPRDIVEYCYGRSIGYITHKHIPPNEYSKVGYFNVGIIFFNNDPVGYACAKWWRDIGIDPNNRWAKVYGTCGDQKYLELFYSAFRQNYFQIIDSSIGHTAPWNITRSEIKDGFVTWDSTFVLQEPKVTQKLYFHHFSHFSLTEDSYKLDWDGEWGNFINNPGAPQLYEDYYNRCIHIKNKYNV